MPTAPTVGTTNFSADVDILIRDAYRMVGVRSAEIDQEDARLAMRQLQYMLLDWSNRGVYVYGVDSTSLVTAAGTARYTLPGRATRVYQAVRRNADNDDLPLTPVDRETYNRYPHKDQAGEPTVYYHQDLQAESALYLWPVPDTVTTIVVWFSRQLTDIERLTSTIDVPTKFIPAAVSGLALRLSRLRSDFDATNLAVQAETEFYSAWIADRERVDVQFSLG